MATSSTTTIVSETVKDPLPSDLRKILRQVARNGRCSWLPWQRGDDQQLQVAKIRKVATTHLNGKRKRPDTSGQSDRSGSEFDDSTHYECDSEGTSTTTNSERSAEKRNKPQRLLQTTIMGGHRSRYTSLGQAFATAIGLVLDHSYRTQGGYKMSPAEIRMYANAAKKLSPKEVFQQRRQRLIALVNHDYNGNGQRDGPPFTMQRMAEVLLAPDRYYKLTHKLCNCLEKLLMIRSSIQAFGGSTGGHTLQSRREEREMAALAFERERQESEQRNRRFRKQLSPSSAPDLSPEILRIERNSGSGKASSEEYNSKSLEKASTVSASDAAAAAGKVNSITRESVEAKASLRNKFEHGSDQTAVQQIQSTRSMTTSPPPPSMGAATAIPMASHSTVASFVRHLTETQLALPETQGLHGEVSTGADAPSLLYPVDAQVNAAGAAMPNLNSNGNVQQLTVQQLLQLQQATALVGVMGTTPLDLLIDRQQGEPHIPNGSTKYGEADAEVDRSSASNSDVDSESDDFSLDDSASDRSDGSDSGAAYEPFSAARVIALNRMQQQQRLQQIRVQSLGQLRPHVDMEYQSGDSIDSTLADDSGGSDSSSSDLAD